MCKHLAAMTDAMKKDPIFGEAEEFYPRVPSRYDREPGFAMEHAVETIAVSDELQVMIDRSGPKECHTLILTYPSKEDRQRMKDFEHEVSVAFLKSKEQRDRSMQKPRRFR